MSRKLNEMMPLDFRNLVFTCGLSQEYANRMKGEMPFQSIEALLSVSDKVWSSLPQSEKLRAISAHPRIGQKVSKTQLREKSAQLSNEEQEDCSMSMDEKLLERLYEKNEEYFRNFGFIFLICATGKSAEQILSSLNERLKNSRDDELRIAEEEHMKITRSRLSKLFT